MSLKNDLKMMNEELNKMKNKIINEDNAIKLLSEKIEALENEARNSIFSILDNNEKINNWIENYDLKNSDYYQANEFQGIDFMLDISEIENDLKNFPNYLEYCNEWADNYCARFEFNDAHYPVIIQSTCEESFINLNSKELIYCNEFYSNNSIHEAILKFEELCQKNGYYPGLYSFSRYGAHESIHNHINMHEYFNENALTKENREFLLELFELSKSVENSHYVYCEELINLINKYGYSIGWNLNDEDNTLEFINLNYDIDSFKTDSIRFNIGFYDEMNEQSDQFEALITLRGEL